MPCCRLHGAVEVRRDAGEFLVFESIEHDVPDERPHVLHTFGVDFLQTAGKRRDIRQLAQTNDASHQGVVAVEVEPPQPPESQDEVDDQEEHQHRQAKDRMLA